MYLYDVLNFYVSKAWPVEELIQFRERSRSFSFYLIMRVKIHYLVKITIRSYLAALAKVYTLRVPSSFVWC